LNVGLKILFKLCFEKKEDGEMRKGRLTEISDGALCEDLMLSLQDFEALEETGWEENEEDETGEGQYEE
jgi:hypothetical protein